MAVATSDGRRGEVGSALGFAQSAYRDRVRRVGREERGVAAGFGIVERNNHGLESASGVGSAQLIECQVDPRAVRSVLVPQPALVDQTEFFRRRLTPSATFPRGAG